MRIAGDEYISRVFTVLSLISKSSEPLSLDAVTEDTALPKPTVFRLLKSLCSLGYIQATPNRFGYRVTDKIMDLLPSDSEAWICDQAIPLLEQIHKELNETVNLGRMEGLRLRYVHILESTQQLRWIPDDRLHEELLQTALGRAMVAYFPRERLNAILPELCQRTGYIDVDAMQSELNTIRRKGWAMEQNQSCAGVSCYAIPIFKSNEVISAISVSVPNVRLESGGEKYIIKALKRLNNRLAE